MLEEDKINIYIPVSETAYKMDERKYSYNKDSVQWFCDMGNCTVKKQNYKRKNNAKDYYLYRYYFEREKCKNCPIRAECEKGSRAAKMLEVGINTPRIASILSSDFTNISEFMVKMLDIPPEGHIHQLYAA